VHNSGPTRLSQPGHYRTVGKLRWPDFFDERAAWLQFLHSFQTADLSPGLILGLDLLQLGANFQFSLSQTELAILSVGLAK
jgi:hypothetical protein